MSQAQNAIPAAHWNHRTAQRFNTLFDAITKTVEFKPCWHNGTGYFNDVVNDKQLHESLGVGELVKCLADDGRKLIIIGTAVTPVVVFQRDCDDFRHCMNGPLIFKQLRLLSGVAETVHEYLMDELFGTADTYNVGQRLVDIAKLLAGELHLSNMSVAPDQNVGLNDAD